MIPHRIAKWIGGCGAAHALAFVGILTSFGRVAQADIEADPTFHFPDTPELQGVYWCHLLPDGRFLAGGGDKAFRLKSDGSLDLTFPVPKGGFIRKPVLEPNGGFTGFGTYSDSPVGPSHPFGHRFGPDGTVDDTFQPGFGEFCEPILSRRDLAGRYLVSGINLPGMSGPHNWGLIRLKADGSIDPTFEVLTNFAVSAITAERNGGWAVVGSRVTDTGTGDSGHRLLRLGPDGHVLSERDLEAGPSNAVDTRTLTQLSAGRYLFGGEGPMLGVFRWDGKLDPSFRHIWGEGPSDPSVSATVRLKNGRVLVGCAWAGPYLAHTREWPLPDTEPSWPATGVFRALPDGMVDLSFVSAELPGGAYDLVAQPDGKFVIADGQKLHRYQETLSPAVFAFGEKVVTVDESARYAKFTLYRAGNVRSRGSVTLTTESSSSAKVRRDFRRINRRINFAPGEWKRTIVLPVRDDAVIDGTQSVTVKLSKPDPGSRLYEVSTVRIDILDNDQ